MLMYAAIEFGVTWYIVEMISVLKYCKTNQILLLNQLVFESSNFIGS